MNKLVPKLRFKEFSGEWENRKLSKISNITTGSSNREDSTENDGKYTFFDRSEDIRTSSRYLFDDEAIIIAGEGQKFTPKYYKGKFDLHQRTYAILELQIIGKFLYYYIDKHKNYFLQNAVGSTVKSLRLPMFQKMPILLPVLPEQQKIADTLSSLDKLIEANSKRVEALKEHKKGLMQQLFPTDNEKMPKLRFKEFRGEWEEKQLFEIGKIITGTTPSTKKDEYYQNGQYYWVTPTDISESKEIIKTKKMLTEKGLKVGRFIPKNSLLVTCIASIGKNAILRIDGSCNQQINAVSPYDNYDVDFLYYIIEEKNYILKENAGQGGMSMLNKNDFSNLYFIFPNDKVEQQKIANTLSSLDNLIEANNKKVEALKEHKKGLMQQMFVSEELEDE